MTYTIKLIDKTEIIVSDNEYEKIFQASLTGGDKMIRSKDMAFKLNQIAKMEKNKHIIDQSNKFIPELANSSKTKNRDKWLEVFKRNRELMASNQPPKWTLVNGVMTEKENYWRETA